MNSRVDIITVVSGILEITKNYIESVINNTKIPFRLIIVDNKSDSFTIEYLRSLKDTLKDRLTLIENSENLGWIKAVNQGFKISTASYACVMNNDVIVSAGWLDNMVETMDKNPQIGHMPINVTGPVCNCGGIACLERYIGNRYILERAKKVFGNNITLERVSELAESGNKKAIAIWLDVAGKLGAALTQVVNLLNPDRIVIGGGVSLAGGLILKPLIKEVKKRAMKDQAKHVKNIHLL